MSIATNTTRHLCKNGEFAPLIRPVIVTMACHVRIMTQTDALRLAFRDPPKPPASRREQRALRTKAQALSPVRILLSLALAPVVAAGLTVSIFVRTSEYEAPDALRHLIALAGCNSAAKLNMTDIPRGAVGYHPRNDADGDGISCESGRVLASAETAEVSSPQAVPMTVTTRSVGGAKFLRPDAASQ